jgi:hypothetical protein
MRIRRSILFLTIVAALLVALTLWYGKKKPVEMPLATSTETNIAPVETSESHPPVAAPIIQTNAPAVNTGAATIVANMPKPSAESKTERMREVLSTYNDVPIDFYGKLEDQSGDPVTGAEVKGSIRVINGARQATDWFSATSDASGLFQFHGKGQDIGIAPKKSGYAYVSMNGTGNYSHLYPEEERAHPDPNNPVVIKMWKLQGAEPLLPIERQYKLPFTGAPMVFDLLAGTCVSDGGDVKITVVRPPGVISQRNKQDWSVEIEAVDGGLMDSQGTERITYFAPATGYQPSYTIAMTATNIWPHNWFDSFNQGFYVKSRNGQVYSKLGMSFRLNNNPDDPMYIRFGGVANTNGSLNWEGDPNTYKPQ